MDSILETHEKIFYLIEVAKGKYLVSYSQEGCYMATGRVYVSNAERYGKNLNVEMETDSSLDPDEIRRSAMQFKSVQEAFEYIEKWGTFSDLCGWCGELCKKYGGNPEHYPKLKEVHTTLTVDLGDFGATMLKRETH